jgi:Neutral trehalase
MRRQLRSNAFRHLRAGAASGWDFSSRWFADGEHIHSIETTNIIPVDLNSLLYQLEIVIARAYQVSGVQAQSTAFLKKANKRALLINKYCWNKTLGYYADYHFANQTQLERITAAGMFPFALLPLQLLEGKMSTAKSVLQNHLLKDGGILTTPVSSHQQWDAPNGWAPLQWMSIWALDRNNEKALAKDIAQRWCQLNVGVFMRTGKLMEKYNVVNTQLDAGGGEYPSQDGFGWTNGVLLALMKKYGITQ